MDHNTTMASLEYQSFIDALNATFGNRLTVHVKPHHQGPVHFVVRDSTLATADLAVDFHGKLFGLTSPDQKFQESLAAALRGMHFHEDRGLLPK
jgi:hypothetical protein